MGDFESIHQQPLISIGSSSSNGKDQGSNNGKNQIIGAGKDEGDISSLTTKRKRNPSARTRGMNLVKEEKFKGGGIENHNVQLIKKYLGPQDHDLVISFGHRVTPKDVQGPQPGKVNLLAEIQEKNEQINLLGGHVDALELNHRKKTEEMQTAHEMHMAEMKECHQQDMAKIEDAHHKGMATVGSKLKLLTKLVLQQRSYEMHLSGVTLTGNVRETHNIERHYDILVLIYELMGFAISLCLAS
ncbi:hypothetical protein Cgig2_021643 [Carnegiea gigantea]|uniref:Uncharacterized protein n=1 Tax=Carnegiea gigantea TaxID=171969 RepID=A0A9Q1K1Z8_9CARY|nr:hypothetical protein Cgig2_021643 [Carnegiea gigantea]